LSSLNSSAAAAAAFLSCSVDSCFLTDVLSLEKSFLIFLQYTPTATPPAIKTSVKKHESTEQERNAAAAAAEEFNEDK
jgi:hypothetical protein